MYLSSAGGTTPDVALSLWNTATYVTRLRTNVLSPPKLYCLADWPRMVQILSERKYLHLLDLRCYLMKAIARHSSAD